MSTKAEAIVAGHICLDLIPTLGDRGGQNGPFIEPGKLICIGPAVTGIGGVANTGVALHRLGMNTALMCKVGTDTIGRAIIDLLEELDPRLATGMIQSKGADSSYTVVISPPGIDRCFLHCPGANDTFCAEDVAYDRLDGSRLFHFGYPTLMKHIYSDGGRDAALIFKRVKEQGLATSLDMSLPDPQSAAGKVNWRAWLEQVLPHVDIFLPSIDELLLMLDRPRFDRWQSDGPGRDETDLTLPAALADQLLEMGVSMAVIKLGDVGLYLKTSSQASKIAGMGPDLPTAPERWISRELYTNCFTANLVGTTGSGDSTIAGFMSGLLKGLSPQDTLTAATAVGACSVEKPDATSGVPHWDTIQKRLADSWAKLEKKAETPHAKWKQEGLVWSGPGDSKNA